MHASTRKRLNEFATRHPEFKAALARWYKHVRRLDFDSFAALRQLSPFADQVGKLTVLNVAGNRVRLIAAVHYNRRKIYIRAVLTHDEYDEEKWKE
jgi:mRNA interferase HigB